MSFQKLHTIAMQLSTPEVSDALDYLGVKEIGLQKISPIVQGVKMFGKAFTVRYAPNEESGFIKAGSYIDEVSPENVIVVDNNGIPDYTVWGDILTAFAHKKGIQGTVIHGVCRDVQTIRKLNYPVFSIGTFMMTGKGRGRLQETNGIIHIQGVEIHPNDFIFGDDNGVIRIPQSMVEEVLQIALQIQTIEEKIVDAILKEGMSLEAARKTYGYNKFGYKK
ncbi:MAG: RraA family protein [Bacteroidia bacterium]